MFEFPEVFCCQQPFPEDILVGLEVYRHVNDSLEGEGLGFLWRQAPLPAAKLSDIESERQGVSSTRKNCCTLPAVGVR